MATSKTFRPDGVGSRQRLAHFVLAATSLAFFVATGAPALIPYLLVVMLLHVRPNRVRGRNVMEIHLRGRELALGRAWTTFTAVSGRRAMALAARSPSVWLGVAWLFALFVLALLVGERVADAPFAVGVVARAVFALAASGALWAALFGIARRTRLLFGADGVRVGATYVPYATVRGVERRGEAVVIGRGAHLPSIVVRTADIETADRLVVVLTSEQDRAGRRRAEPSPPLPAAGFREGASNVGWRVRLLDASSEEERDAILARVRPEDLRELLDETADPALEEALAERVEKAR